MEKEALYYKPVPVGKVRCVLCPHRCTISNKKSGICLARQNKDGVLYTKTYGGVTSYADDPVEKKPLYHFYPGTKLFSIGTWGCNFKCTFCQNWQISQVADVPLEKFTPEEIVSIAKDNGSTGIAYTYNEPTVWYEYVMDISKLAKESGLKNVWVTNGFISEEPLKDALPYIDAMNIDVKAAAEAFYREVCNGQLEPVMRTLKMAHAAGVHVEATTLVIPTLNDKGDVGEIAEWLSSVSPEIPLHLSRYYPQYKMDIEPTEIEVLKIARETALKKLKYVYLGNVPSDAGGSDTVCPSCNEVLIKRDFYSAQQLGIDGGKCVKCKTEIYGKF